MEYKNKTDLSYFSWNILNVFLDQILKNKEKMKELKHIHLIDISMKFWRKWVFEKSCEEFVKNNMKISCSERTVNFTLKIELL